MKVRLEAGYKDHYTITDLERAKGVISAEKMDESTAAEYALIAARAAASEYGDSVSQVLKADAETAKNNRIEFDSFCDGSGLFDVWITYTAETFRGFIKGGAYLSDIWQINEDNRQTENAFIRYFKEA